MTEEESKAQAFLTANLEIIYIAPKIIGYICKGCNTQLRCEDIASQRLVPPRHEEEYHSGPFEPLYESRARKCVVDAKA